MTRRKGASELDPRGKGKGKGKSKSKSQGSSFIRMPRAHWLPPQDSKRGKSLFLLQFGSVQ